MSSWDVVKVFMGRKIKNEMEFEDAMLDTSPKAIRTHLIVVDAGIKA